MLKAVAKGAIIGGVLVFIWMAVSWMFIPWHKATVNQFENPIEVASVVKKNAPFAGVYVYPMNYENNDSSMSHSGEPLIFLSVSYMKDSGMNPMTFLYSLLTQILGAAILSIMMYMAAHQTYFAKLVFAILFGFGIGVLGNFPAWNWMGFPTNWVWVEIADLTIGWFIAGLFLAGFIKEDKASNQAL